MADYDYIDKGTGDGTVLGQKTTSKIGFWGITPVDQPAALTAAKTAVTHVSATASDGAIAIMVSGPTAVGFSNTAEAQTLLSVVENLQVRLGEVETALVEVGLLAGGTATALTDTKYDIVGKGGGGDGMILGQDSSEKISFWGTTPCDQPAALTAQLGTITCTAAGTTDYAIQVLVTGESNFGFTTVSEAHTFLAVIANLQARMVELDTKLVEIGIISGGTALATATAQFDFLDKGNDDGTILGRDSSALLAFWGGTPCDQLAALTTALTTITHTLTASPDYAFAALASGTASFMFVNGDEAQSLLMVVQNIQVRMAELEARLEEAGLIAA
jgi:hypothetical protein